MDVAIAPGEPFAGGSPNPTMRSQAATALAHAAIGVNARAAFHVVRSAPDTSCAIGSKGWGNDVTMASRFWQVASVEMLT